MPMVKAFSELPLVHSHYCQLQLGTISNIAKIGFEISRGNNTGGQSKSTNSFCELEYGQGEIANHSSSFSWPQDSTISV